MRRTIILLLIPLLILPPLTPLWSSIGGSAAPVTGCSCATCPSGLATTPSTSTSGVAKGRVVEHEWLNGSRREKATREALSTDEYRRVEAVLRRMGYTPSPEEAVALRFVREESERVEYVLVGIPFKGNSKQPAFTIVALKPVVEAMAFQVTDGNRTLRLIAREPRDKPSRILPSSALIRSERSAAFSGQWQPSCPRPSCPPCYAPDCQCRVWNWASLIMCGAYTVTCGVTCYTCIVTGSGTACLLCVVCALAVPACFMNACVEWVGVCVDCLSVGCRPYRDCCERCPLCQMDHRCYV